MLKDTTSTVSVCRHRSDLDLEPLSSIAVRSARSSQPLCQLYLSRCQSQTRPVSYSISSTQIASEARVHSLGIYLNQAVRAGHDPHRRSLDLLPKSLPPSVVITALALRNCSTPRDSFVSLRSLVAPLCLSTLSLWTYLHTPRVQLHEFVCRVVVLEATGAYCAKIRTRGRAAVILIVTITLSLSRAAPLPFQI
jgi:hypothetical protein